MYLSAVSATEEKSKNTPLKLFRDLLEHPDYSDLSENDFSGFSSFESPLLIPDMEKAVSYLKDAISGKKHISILGDRDVDGVASTAMLGSFLKEHHEKNGGRLSIRVSDSGDDYGISGNLYKDLLELKADLYIFLDMGSSHREEVSALIENDSKVIILDHHQIPDEGPVFEDSAFVNPVRNPALSKFATVMVCLKFLSAYALSCTKEWETAYLLNFDSYSSGNVAKPLYRCGLYLGSFSDSSEAKIFLKEKFPDLEITELNNEQNGPQFIGKRDIQKIFKDFNSGGGLLLAARIRTMPRMSRFLHGLTDLLSVGTIADMMPLRGENRMLARIGMGFEGIGKSLFPVYRSGYRSLLKTLGIKEQRISSRDVGWGIAPAVNAAGRMGETKMALDLLLESGEEKSLQLAKNLSKLNGERKKRTARNEDIIESLLNENPEKLNHPFLFCYHPDLEPGVSGIVATRLTEKFHKPVIYVNPDGPHARGSARTFANINVLDFISRAAEHFIQFGGHPEACGFSLEYDKIEDLEKSLQLNCNDIPRIQKNHNPSDFHIELSPGSLTWKAHEELELLEPFGTGNPEPRIKISSVFITDFSLMADVHAKFSIREAPSYLECIYWKKGEELKELYEKKASVNLIGCLEKSFFRGRKSLRFRLEEIVL